MSAFDSIKHLMNTQIKSVWATKIKCFSPWFVCFLLAYASSYILSGVSAPQPDLDESYQSVLEYAKFHDFQFGKDIIFTFGPLGFLNSWVSQGLFPVHRILFALFWGGFVAFSATSIARQIPGWIKFVFLVWFLIYSNYGWLDQHAFLIMVYGCTILLGDLQRRKVVVAVIIAVFAILALIKFTFFMAVSFGVILCALMQIGKREFKASLIIALFYGTAFIALWLSTGQGLENLIPWIRGSLEIAAGYTDAMTIFPKVKVLVICSIAGALFLASVLMIIRFAQLNVSSMGILIVTTAYVFLSWKSGFVRADGHVMGFIFFLPLAHAILLTEPFQKEMNRKLQICLISLFLGVVLLCNWAADIQEPGTMLTKLIDWPRCVIRNTRLICNSVTGHWEKNFISLRENNLNKQEPDLPIAKNMVGKATVDVMNYRQWAALSNNLNYSPRPVFQGYCVYTPFLQDLNLSYFKSERRPQYLLFKMESVDNRYPALDDATLLPYVLSNYRPVARDGDFLVLKVLQNISRDRGNVLVRKQTIAFGEHLDLSAYKNSLLIMHVNLKTTFLGRVVKFFFQPPIITMKVKANGNEANYRFIPAMAERGFIVSPILLTNNDIMHYYDRSAVNCAESISFSKPKYTWGQLSNTVTVMLYKQEKLY